MQKSSRRRDISEFPRLSIFYQPSWEESPLLRKQRTHCLGTNQTPGMTFWPVQPTGSFSYKSLHHFLATKNHSLHHSFVKTFGKITLPWQDLSLGGEHEQGYALRIICKKATLLFQVGIFVSGLPGVLERFSCKYVPFLEWSLSSPRSLGRWNFQGPFFVWQILLGKSNTMDPLHTHSSFWWDCVGATSVRTWSRILIISFGDASLHLCSGIMLWSHLGFLSLVVAIVLPSFIIPYVSVVLR